MKVTRLVVLLFCGLSICLVLPLANGAIGDGRLFVYSDSGYANLVAQDANGRYEVLPGTTVYIKISGITEFEPGDEITVKIGWDHTKHITGVFVKNGDYVGDAVDPLEWEVGDFDDGFFDIPASNTLTVHYKGLTGPDYITVVEVEASPEIKTAHMHVIPEIPVLGTLGMILTMFTGFLYLKNKGKWG
jgi:hypothetical protein